MSEDIVWGSNTTPGTTAPAREGRKEVRRCGACRTIFPRPLGSDLTHQQADESVDCPPDAGVQPVTTANRWRRR